MERIQKLIAAAGIASRRKAEKMIAEGRVTLNGKVVTEPGTKADVNDVITVDGKPLRREEKVYYVMNKPKGVICSVSKVGPGGVSPSIHSIIPHVHKVAIPVLSYCTRTGFCSFKCKCKIRIINTIGIPHTIRFGWSSSTAFAGNGIPPIDIVFGRVNPINYTHRHPKLAHHLSRSKSIRIVALLICMTRFC